MPSDTTRRVKRHHAHRAQIAADAEIARGMQAGMAAGPRVELPEDLDPDDFEARCLASPSFFTENCLHTMHIDTGRTVPFRLQPGQKMLFDVVERELPVRPVRVICLKSRRQLITTACQALGYWFTSTHDNVDGAIIAYKQDLTEEIFERGIKFFYEHDERRELGIRPKVRGSNKRELKFGESDAKARDAGDLGLNSVLRVTSADSKEPGRGGTKQFVHGSEVPYWPEDPPPWQSIGIALSNAIGTIAVLEGTANGQAGFFHETWIGAMKGLNEWTPLFLPWFIDPRNRVRLTPEEIARWTWGTEFEKAEEELQYAKRYGLTLEQLAWRRRTVRSPVCYKPGTERLDVFRQEYPADPDEAFLSSGKNFFLLRSVKDHETHPEKGARAPLAIGRIENEGPPLEDRGPGRRTPVKPVFVEDPAGELRIWARPDPLSEYLVVVDPAEGIEGRDQSVIGVLDRPAFDWVALFRSTRHSTRELAQIAALVGWWYGSGGGKGDGAALLGVEQNNQGLAVLQELLRILYPRLWYHRDVTKPGSEPTDKAGWVQSNVLRMYALKLLESEVRASPVAMGLHEREAFEQMRTFVWPKPKAGQVADVARPGAMAGKHDDIVLMLAIGLGIHVNAAITKRKQPPKPVADPNELLHPEPMNLRMGKTFERSEKRRIRPHGGWGRNGGRR